jgi:hypothetical protein
MAIYFEADDDLPDLPPEELVRQRKYLSVDHLYRLAERLKFDRLCIRSQLEEAEGCMDDEATKAWRRRARFAYDAKGLSLYYIGNELARRNRQLRLETPELTLAQSFMCEAKKYLDGQRYQQIYDQASRKAARLRQTTALKWAKVANQ